MSSPLIGVTCSASVSELGVRTYSLAADYTMAIERAGGIPVMLPLHIQNVEVLLEKLDGVVFSGGGDIEPSLFNQEAHETISYVDAERDAFEMKLMGEAFTRDMPVLAICRGMQVMNVQRGGTLIQDIPSQTDSTMQHSQREAGHGEHEATQTATVLAGDNPLSQSLGEGTVHINSFHHQSVGDLADSLEIVAKANDGIVEAIYAPGQTFAIGTQWHPERLAAAQAEQQELFNNLIAAANTFAGR